MHCEICEMEEVMFAITKMNVDTIRRLNYAAGFRVSILMKTGAVNY